MAVVAVMGNRSVFPFDEVGIPPSEPGYGLLLPGPVFETTVSLTLRRAFDPHALLATIAEGRKVLRFAKKQRIFAQGDKADAVFYIQTGARWAARNH
jgi:hypothetical protein